MTKICIICGEEELSERSRLAIGPNCRASINRWGHRPLQERINRRNALRRYDARMAMVDDTDVVLVTKTNREKYLNDDAYVHLTRDRYIRSDKAPRPFKQVKRKPKKSARVVFQGSGARA